MNFLIWLSLAVVLFAFVALVRRWHDYSMLFMIAIGFAVNANIYNGSTTPIYVGQFVFSVDSILFTGFLFSVLICAKCYSVRKSKILASSTIAAILLSAVIEFLAEISTYGYSFQYLSNFLGYFFSAFGSFLGIWTMLFVFQKLENRKVNIYLSLIVCNLIGSIINSSVYYTGTFLVSGNIANIAYILLGSYIGKLVCILISLLVYFINTKIWVPKDLLIDKEKNKNQNDY